ncbi:hypothetical protein MKZ38_010785 [Zalerion maritima]|uniref:Uncharacterized protein n=1 Tax=Zalerion maritima TaxID=339359 RepID=A0AAD5WXS1_9PEZI|nr:hypothetical protein MKZ38_010785 [Zalerion maritima]
MGLILKRKRSESELSMTSSQFSSPPRHDKFSSMMDTDLCSPTRPRSSTPSHLTSRTFKRFRDNRPSDEEVHRKFYEWRVHHQNPEPTPLPPKGLAMLHQDSCSPSNSSQTGHTLGLLYKAQNNSAFSNNHPRQPQPAVASPFPQPVQHAQHAATKAQGQQASLHSFFKIPGSAPSSTTSSVSPVMEAQNCQDCGNRVSGSDDDIMMDVDDYGFSSSVECGCVACGKVVCSQCSVSNLSEQRRCLVCAGKKEWIGGIGWTIRGVGVC